MRKGLHIIALLGSLLAISPLLANAASYGLVNIQQEYDAFKSDFPADPDALKAALEAYDCGVSDGYDSHPYILTIVDYSLPSYERRLWVIDLATHQLLYHTYVAHGAGSGSVNATYFSNTINSDASSIGLYRTGISYPGEWGYSMRLFGLENGYNSNAYRRAVVMHPGSYVSTMSIIEYGMIGMTHGCLAVPNSLDKSIINTVKDGSFIFAYYPKPYWLATSQFLHCAVLKEMDA